ncbi:hypothetical protein ES332_D11G341500v1 [Gossypium tomentosum]|uniref:Uncharacterized protein n=1 Tax=Gossypium tomentosum TaxID=34277 RepID=A0A5D2IWN7_GOSTO|nr:hypothetical protein ES332_D11G341500v1 [Gossypium tomentosum]
MSSSKLPSSTHGSMSNQKRPTAKFHPSVWGDIFLSSPTTNVDAKTKLQHEELKEEVRRMIKVVMDDELLYKLSLIDTIKRLGVSYHFEREIEEVLLNIYEHDYKDDQTLETTSLQFRLLRENGLGVPCEWFNKFKDDEGNFNMSLTTSYLRVHGEDIVEEALGFTTTHLGLAKASSTIEYPLSALVSHALYQSIRKGLPRLEAKRFISIYQGDASHNKTLLKWKKGLDLATKLPFARDRLVEGYLWILGVYFEPRYSVAREILAKTLDVDYIDQLSKHMKSFYKPLLDYYREKEKTMINQGKSYRIKYAKDVFKQLCESFFVDAKWYNQNYVPTIEEYMRNRVLSTGNIMLTVTYFVGMEDFVTLEIFNWASNNPKIIDASSIAICLMNDVTSHKFEQERGHSTSVVECYMREHAVSKEEACSELKKRELIFSEISKVVPRSVLTRILNFTRVTEFIYKNGDEYTHVEKHTKEGITSLLIDPISVSY